MKTLSMTWASCAVALMLTVSGCYAGGRNAVKPSKNYVTEKVSISDIEAIRSSSSVDVVYTQASGTPYAEIYAPDNIVPLVKVEQDGKDLKIGFKSNTSIQGRYKCEVRVFAPEVTSFSTSSASDITLANGLKTSKPVTLKASSSGDIDASSIQCGDLSMTTSSSGDIKAGTIACGMLALDTQSSGDIKVTLGYLYGSRYRVQFSGRLRRVGNGLLGRCEGFYQLFERHQAGGHVPQRFVQRQLGGKHLCQRPACQGRRGAGFFGRRYRMQRERCALHFGIERGRRAL